MAANTDPRLQNQVIYSIYVRNHTSEGTFRAVIPDLDRIRALGTDIIWLMPIHPIGVEGKKGTLGCPYANRDYRTVNPEYGTLEDFLHLVDAIHDNGMKCIIDVVYNHTSPDSTLVHRHPEYFYRRPDGKRGNKVGILDADITGPSIPKTFGITNPLTADADGILPGQTQTGIKVMSTNLMLPKGDLPVAWRGPVVSNAIRQFWSDPAAAERW